MIKSEAFESTHVIEDTLHPQNPMESMINDAFRFVRHNVNEPGATLTNRETCMIWENKEIMKFVRMSHAQSKTLINFFEEPNDLMLLREDADDELLSEGNADNKVGEDEHIYVLFVIFF